MGHRWMSLQHDGVVMALRAGVDAAQARRELACVCRMALGYNQPVELKEMAWPVELGPAPAAGSFGVSADAQLGAAVAAHDGRSAHCRILAAHAEAVESRGFRYRLRRKQDRRELISPVSLSYLYGTVKTHKDPYGWRFLAGGVRISVGPISDWLRPRRRSAGPFPSAAP